MLAGRGKLLVGTGIFLLTFGFSMTNYLFIVIGIFTIMSSLVSLPLFELNINVDNLKVKRYIDKKKIFQDDFIHVTVELKNIGKKRFDFVEIKDIFPEQYFDCVLGEPNISTRIDPKKKIKYSYILKPRIRGEFFIGPIELTIKDRLEFNKESREVPESYTRLVIYPPYGDLRKLEALRGRTISKMFGVHRSVQVGTGTDFHGIRQYQFGDEFRKINWKATARLGQIMVREYEMEKNINVLIAIDASSTMGAGILLNTKLEYSIRAAIVLCKLALEHKDSVGAVIFQSNPRRRRDTRESVKLLESHSGDTVLFNLLDFVATIHPMGPKNLSVWMDQLVRRLHKRHLIVFLSDLEAPMNDIRLMFTKARARSHELLVISPFSPWFEVLGKELTPAERAIAEAISEEMMQHALESKQIAQSLGIPVINVGPDDIISQTLQEYLKAKAKGKAQL
ncbi:MAG: DUF58 domain-containing protein [Promethearchaeota archaeon]